MSAVTQNDITEAYKRAGAVPGDTIVYHGSMKSIGYVEGGADALIDGILNSAAPGGTAAIGTLWYNGKVEERPPEKFDIANNYGFLTSKHRHFADNETIYDGLFLAGTCKRPMTIPKSIKDGASAATEIDFYLKNKQ